MWTKRIELRIGKADGTKVTIPMRYNGSHQRGYRCFTGELVEAPEHIKETTSPSFEGRRLFDALVDYRKTIEPGGWRLLHAVARRDCWPKPDELDTKVQRLTHGAEQTERIDGFEQAEFAEVATIREQQDAFEQWKSSLEPVFAPRAPRKSGHEHDQPVVDFGPIARLAGEYLMTGKPDAERIIRRLRQPKPPGGGQRSG